MFWRCKRSPERVKTEEEVSINIEAKQASIRCEGELNLIEVSKASSASEHISYADCAQQTVNLALPIPDFSKISTNTELNELCLPETQKCFEVIIC